ncbi:TolC family protein [Thalassomonas viridans]|uniref:TolC family protein n=1 Tax=Thalassomonas viridans TaxID=137584 RepID=A0AAE9Z106_9GAMM|nr:TolC family protein [Thalassomonas viridans]WDE04059.1 TolC family protein [Thalassomonas viridans]
MKSAGLAPMTFIPLIVLSGFGLSGPALGSAKLSFEQVTELAFRQNPALLGQQENTYAKDAGEKAAFRQLLPNFSASTRGDKVLQGSSADTPDDTLYSTRLTLSQPLYRPALWANYQKSTLEQIDAGLSLARTREQLLFDLKTAWYQLLTAQLLVAESRESLDRLRQHQKNAEHMYANALIWSNDVLQAKVRVSSGRQDLLVSKNNVLDAKRRLNVLMDREITFAFEARGELDYSPVKWQYRDAVAYTLDHRAELKQTQLDIALARQDRNIAKADMKPSLDLNLQRGSTAFNSNFDNSVTETQISLSLQWNFWQWGKTSQQVAALDFDLRRLSLDLRQQKNQFQADVHAVWLKLQEADNNLKVLQQSLALAKENFRVSQIRYKEQLGSSNDVLDAQDLLTQTRTNHIQALGQFLTAKAELDYVLGVPVDSRGQLRP